MPLGERRRERIPPAGVSSTCEFLLLEAEAAENGEGVGRLDLPDEVAAGLYFAVDARGEGLGVLLARRADDQVVEAALGPVALLLETIRQLGRVLVRAAFHAHLPR